MALKAGELKRDTADKIAEDFAGSMSEAILNAFKTEWKIIMRDTKTPEAPAFTPQTELLFVAVAQGVVKHLLNNELTVKFEYNNGSTLTTLTGKLTITS